MNEPLKATPARMMFLGIGWFGAQFFWGFHSASIPLFLRNFTESKFVISCILSLPGLAGCVVPPIAGYLSDRARTRFGRRKPFVFLGAFGMVISLLCLPHMAAFAVVALLSGMMYFSLRLAETPYLSLLPDTTLPEQRSTASGVMNLCGSIGLISYFILGSAIWDSNPTAVFRMVGAVALLALLTAILLIREPEVPLSNEAGQYGTVVTGPLGYLKGLIAETNAMKFYVAQFFWWLGFWMISSFITLFLVEELGVPEGKSFLVLMAFSVVATVFMLPLGMLGDRIGRKGIITFMLVFWAVAGVMMGLSQNFTHALITVGITGIPFAAVMGVGLAFFLDLVPKERTAEFVGFSIISVSGAQLFGPLIGGRLIDALGYRPLFPAAAAFMVLGMILLQFIGPREKKPESGQ